jgi:enterochelin esterase family protein
MLSQRLSPPERRHPTARRTLVILLLVFAVTSLAVGAVGAGRYIETFWLYRGFAAPTRPSSVTVANGSSKRRVPVGAGLVENIDVPSPALGGRLLQVVVYLPPGYKLAVRTRYPVLYLLHGFPGSPMQFVNIGDLAVTADVLLAEHRMEPMIVVMPSGTTSFFVDDEWANSIRRDNDWETFVARDLVRAIDRRYRTRAGGRERGIGGLSEGGYGALNIAFHHLGEFDLVEGWSAYYLADRAPGLFGDDGQLLAYNSPALELAHVAPRLRRDDSEIWLYSGNRDSTLRKSAVFAAELGRLHIAHSFSVHGGRHNWQLWRSMMANSLIVASRYFEHGAS